MSPRVTVVIPVFNRDEKLRSALVSVQKQTFSDFECIVVDDGSTIPIEPIVTGLRDPRFVYVRNDRNGGPYNARTVGYELMTGEYLFHLDSDWEAFPWALAQATHYLDTTPKVDAVAGLHINSRDSSLFVRVRDRARIVTPDEAANLRKVPDCVGAVRRCVVDEWLEKRRDYFAFESHQWFTFSIAHSQLYVDEPWTRYCTEGADRVTGVIDERRLNDFVIFLEEHRGYAETMRSAALDDMLIYGWRVLSRAGRKDAAAAYEACLRRRGVEFEERLGERAFRSARSLIVRALRRIVRAVELEKRPVYYL